MTKFYNIVKRKGGSLVGFADLQHIPPEIPHHLLFGISVAIALDPKIVAVEVAIF